MNIDFYRNCYLLEVELRYGSLEDGLLAESLDRQNLSHLLLVEKDWKKLSKDEKIAKINSDADDISDKIRPVMDSLPESMVSTREALNKAIKDITTARLPRRFMFGSIKKLQGAVIKAEALMSSVVNAMTVTSGIIKDVGATDFDGKVELLWDEGTGSPKFEALPDKKSFEESMRRAFNPPAGFLGFLRKAASFVSLDLSDAMSGAGLKSEDFSDDIMDTPVKEVMRSAGSPAVRSAESESSSGPDLDAEEATTQLAAAAVEAEDTPEEARTAAAAAPPPPDSAPSPEPDAAGADDTPSAGGVTAKTFRDWLSRQARKGNLDDLKNAGQRKRITDYLRSKGVLGESSQPSDQALLNILSEYCDSEESMLSEQVTDFRRWRHLAGME